MLPFHHPFHSFCQLFVNLLLFWPNGGHLRPTPPLFLCFLMCLVSSPQTREPAIASANLLLGAWTDPWGVTAQWFGGTAALSIKREQSRWIGRWRLLILIVVCCVCVCGCVLCVGATFSYHTGRKPTLAKAKMANFCKVIDQNFCPITPNINGCANLSWFRDVAHV